jgi:hypothetical protein
MTGTGGSPPLAMNAKPHAQTIRKPIEDAIGPSSLKSTPQAALGKREYPSMKIRLMTMIGFSMFLSILRWPTMFTAGLTQLMENW